MPGKPDAIHRRHFLGAACVTKNCLLQLSHPRLQTENLLILRRRVWGGGELRQLGFQGFDLCSFFR